MDGRTPAFRQTQGAGEERRRRLAPPIRPPLLARPLSRACAAVADSTRRSEAVRKAEAEAFAVTALATNAARWTTPRWPPRAVDAQRPVAKLPLLPVMLVCRIPVLRWFLRCYVRDGAGLRCSECIQQPRDRCRRGLRKGLRAALLWGLQRGCLRDAAGWRCSDGTQQPRDYCRYGLHEAA